ncbi:MAG TPA: hypothetical protein VEX15_21305 [Nocardioidaceae bacterium]|nr:hypothetical protein [Nocardioidaceae bacterium]
MYARSDASPPLAALASRQSGVATRRQIVDLGLTHGFIEHQIAAQRWSAYGRHTILMQNASPSRTQLMWIAVLDADSPAALASHTALEYGGFRGFAHEAKLVHIVVDRGARYVRMPGVRVHESRRFSADDIVSAAGVPRVSNARGAIDAGAWQRRPRFACAMMAAVVQQGMCTPRELHAELDTCGAIRHRQHMRLAMLDVTDGARALGELDVGRICRRYGLTPPARQRLRKDSAGRTRYLDCEWDLPNGEVVVLEVDGKHHMDVEHWDADMKRERKIVIGRRWVLRASTVEVRLDGAELAADLAAMGVPKLSGTC